MNEKMQIEKRELETWLVPFRSEKRGREEKRKENKSPINVKQSHFSGSCFDEQLLFV